jgi:hypothetical protein
MRVWAYTPEGEIFPFYEGAPVTPELFKLFEGWNEVSFWLGFNLGSVADILNALSLSIPAPVWDTIAHYDGTAWKQTFLNAPLPSFNTLTSVEFGKTYWIFVTADSTLSFIQ